MTTPAGGSATGWVRTFVDHSGLLVLGTVLALVWANLDPAGYRSVTHGLEFIVNDIGMAFFFALAAKEIVEATAPGGPLHSPGKAALPMLAAVGGMLGPALLFLWLTTQIDRPDLERGWAIPCATDVAFSYLVARVIFGLKHPAIPFLLLLAIADDAIGLMIIAAFYPSGPLRMMEFGVFMTAALALAWWLRKRKTVNFWPYVLGAGALSWIALFRGGLHPALALVPIMGFVPHAARDAGLFVESPSEHDTLNEFEHWWKLPVQVILFFFGLVNAGVVLSGFGAGTWLVLGAMVFGKPIGILVIAALCVAVGLKRPTGVAWKDLIVLGFIAGIGFTVALFFATAAFPRGHLLDETKMGALLSFSAAALAFVAARLLKVGRWSQLQ